MTDDHVTGVQQIAGSNGQQWITCARGGSGMVWRDVQIISA